ncbi:MAG: thiamine pyrophosphate-dependent dehydrogenase E1 component subunit alpha [Gemmatimonadales bacterium]
MPSTSERSFPASVGDLADPACYHGPLDINGFDGAELVQHLRGMLLIRLVEQQLAERRKEGIIRGPVHLGVGQEAVAVGVSHSLRSTDRVFGTHRSHGHVLALGASVRGLFAEVLGKETGLSRGMGGSMHLWDVPHGFYGSVPIVAGTVPLAVGAAHAAKLQGRDDVGVCYFGDGAAEEGVVLESLNLASMLRVPVLFVAENNFFSSHLHIGFRVPFNSTARLAAVSDIQYKIVDGNDVLAVRRAAEELIRQARSEGRPAFLEAATFRWYGHVDWREDLDVGVARSAEDVARWRTRDPVRRLSEALERAGILGAADLQRLTEDLSAEIQADWELAMDDPWPSEDALLGRVYQGGRKSP